jgi:hypothetical protein
MRVNLLICAAFAAAMLPVAAFADDPNDPAMRDAATHARDHEMTRQLNVSESAMVRERDAGYAQGWRNTANLAVNDDYAARMQDHDRAVAGYARDRAQYEQQMQAWRRAVAACRAGDYSACGD